MEKNQQQLPILESRRTFLGQCAAFAGLGAVGCFATLIEGCDPSVADQNYTTVDGTVGANSNELIFDATSLDADGKSFVTTQNGPDGRRMMIIRQSAGTFVALSMQCTHENNPVSPPSGGVINCPYHGSRFDLTGAVLSGPARSALRRYATTFDSSTNRITVMLQ